MIIDWVNKANILEIPELYNWMNRIRLLIRIFLRISICHIYRIQNQVADHLSKEGCSSVLGMIKYTTYEKDTFQLLGHIQISRKNIKPVVMYSLFEWTLQVCLSFVAI